MSNACMWCIFLSFSDNFIIIAKLHDCSGKVLEITVLDIYKRWRSTLNPSGIPPSFFYVIFAFNQNSKVFWLNISPLRWCQYSRWVVCYFTCWVVIRMKNVLKKAVLTIYNSFSNPFRSYQFWVKTILTFVFKFQGLSVIDRVFSLSNKLYS